MVVVPQVIFAALRVVGLYTAHTIEIGGAVYGSFEVHLQTSILSEIRQEEKQQTLLLEGLHTSLGLMASGAFLVSGLSVFSLYRINQLRKSLTRLSSQVDHGFLDLKNFVQECTDVVIDYHYKTNVSQAYQHYLKGMQDLQSALRLVNFEHRNPLLYKSKMHFDQALIIYESQSIIKSNHPAELLKNLEMIAIIESMQGMLWFLLGEPKEAIRAFSSLYQNLDIKLKEIGELADDKTIDLIILDTQAIRNNDMKLLNSYLQELS